MTTPPLTIRYFSTRPWLILSLLLVICTLSFAAWRAGAKARGSVMPPPLSGTRSIGPTGDYVSITAAIADVQVQTLGGALVLELQTNYVSGVETFPIVFTNLTTTAANTLTVRPQTGATNLLITSADTTAATVDLNGAQFVTLDGRGGDGEAVDHRQHQHRRRGGALHQ